MKLNDLYPKRPALREKLKGRFWTKVDIRRDDECWEWQACRIETQRSGLHYGRFGVGGGRTMNAHRVAFMLVNGEVPDSLFVIHSCDNPPCCNPAHLSAGTGKDNAADRDGKGRWKGGLRDPEKAHKRKLAPEQVRDIRGRYASDPRPTRNALAREFGVHMSTIDRVVDGKTWRHERYWPAATLRRAQLLAIAEKEAQERKQRAEKRKGERIKYTPEQAERLIAGLDRMIS